jgi:feruloyl esterase
MGKGRHGLRPTQEFHRLFMVPGMQHCSGDPGTDRFEALTALEQWVEVGVAPGRIIASHVENGVTTMTRPLCPYPQQATYEGEGDTNDAANFACTRPDQDNVSTGGD